MSKAFARRPLQTISVLTLAATTCLVHDKAIAQVPGAKSSSAIAASQTDRTPDPAAREAGTPVLEEIIVTAQQRSESVQEAAVAVAVVTGEQLHDQGVTGLDSLNKLVPSVQIVASGQGNMIFVRGVGNFSFTASTDPATAFNYDGVYMGRSSSTVGNFFDLERIEVLKGPQGTLYGRNATAGAVNILPVQPRLGEWSGHASASYGNYDSLTTEGAVNAPVGDSAALRFSGSYNEHDGYLDDGTSADESGAVRVQFKAELSPGFTARLEANYAHQGGTGISSSYIGRYALDPATQRLIVSSSGLRDSEGLYTPEAATFRASGVIGNLPGRALDPLARRPFADNDLYGAHATFDWTTALGTLTVIPAWAKAERDIFSVNSGQNIGNTQNSHQQSIEVRLVSSTARFLDYIVGAYYFDEHIDDDVHNSTGSAANFIDSDYDTRSPSAYLRLTAHVMDRLRVVGGLRYTEDRKTFNNAYTTLGLVCAPGADCAHAPLLPYTLTLSGQPAYPEVGAPPKPVAPGVGVARRDFAAVGDLSTDKLTYRGAVEWDVIAGSMAYASMETGYRAGGFNNNGDTYAPETITALTVGSKSRFLRDRLQFNAELFDWTYRDQQLTYADIDARGILGALTRNVGRSKIRGVEIDALFALSTTTTLGADAQYLDASYESFTYRTPVRPLTSCNVTPNGGFTVNCSGQPALNSPEWTLNFSVQQVLPLDRFEVVVSANTQYKKSYYTNFDYLDLERQDGFWRTDLEVAMSQPGASWKIAGFVRNIEDERAKAYVTASPGSNLIVSTNGAPRLAGVRLDWKF